MKKTDLAYAAGIIDGDGSIAIYRVKNRGDTKKGYAIQLSVKVGSTDEWICNWLKFAFGGCVHRRHRPTQAGNAVWFWQVYTKLAGEFLKVILPYLKIKQPQAEIAIKFQSAKRRTSHKSEGEWAVEEAQLIMLKDMHNIHKRQNVNGEDNSK